MEVVVHSFNILPLTMDTCLLSVLCTQVWRTRDDAHNSAFLCTPSVEGQIKEHFLMHSPVCLKDI